MDKTACITEDGTKLSYGELKEAMSAFTGHLGPRCLVGIVAANTIGSLIGYVSCIQSKHVVMLLREDLMGNDMSQYINTYHINALWIPEQWQGHELLQNRTPVYSKYGYCLYHISPNVVKMDEHLALLLSTSGTTGGLKMVRLSYQNLRANTRSIVEYLEIHEQDIAITSLPMSYTYGLSVIHSHLYAHATLLITGRKIYTREFWKFFHEQRGTTISGVPYMYQLIRKLGIMKSDIPTLKTITVAGGKIGAEEEEYLIEYSKKYGKRFFVMYGQTEATARISYRPWQRVEEKRGSIGIPVSGGTMWLEDTSGNVIVQPNIMGELVYEGENVSLGYAKTAQDLCKADENQKILHTGDLGYFDEEGYFYITSRKDRNVKINGMRIDLEDMEKKLQQRYPNMNFRCNCEKCMGEQWFQRIVIEVSGNEAKRLSDEDKTELLVYAEKQFGISQRLLKLLFTGYL